MLILYVNVTGKWHMGVTFFLHSLIKNDEVTITMVMVMKCNVQTWNHKMRSESIIFLDVFFQREIFRESYTSFVFGFCVCLFFEKKKKKSCMKEKCGWFWQLLPGKMSLVQGFVWLHLFYSNGHMYIPLHAQWQQSIYGRKKVENTKWFSIFSTEQMVTKHSGTSKSSFHTLHLGSKWKRGGIVHAHPPHLKKEAWNLANILVGT